MKKLGVLAICRDYFVPYISWLMENDGMLFEIVGAIDNDEGTYESIPGYSSKLGVSFDELVNECDVMLSLGYWKIINGDVIKRLPIINLHHSHRLRYRGRHSASWAMINGEQFHGTTLHFMSPKLDDGPIIDTRKVEILDTDTAGTLFKRVNEEGLKMIKEVLPKVMNDEFIELQAPDSEHFSYRERDLTHVIDPTLMQKDPMQFERMVRALTYPGKATPYIKLGDKKVFLLPDHNHNALLSD